MTNVRLERKYIKSLVAITDWSQVWIAWRFHELGFCHQLPKKKKGKTYFKHHSKFPESLLLNLNKMIKGKKNVNITPCSEYKKYKEEHAVPRNDKRYAWWERFRGTRRKVARTVTTKTWQNHGHRIQTISLYLTFKTSY